MQRLKPLSIKNIVPHVEQFAKRADIAITGLQISLSEIAWLEKSFGKAYISHSTKNEENYIFPSVFVKQNHDHANLLLNDNFDAYSFFIATGAEEVVDYVEQSQNIYEKTVDLIVWANLQRVYDRQDDYLEQLKDEVLEKINTTRVVSNSPNTQIIDIEIIRVQDKPEEIFREFSLQLAETKYLFYPYRGFRASLKITFMSNCVGSSSIINTCPSATGILNDADGVELQREQIASGGTFTFVCPASGDAIAVTKDGFGKTINTTVIPAGETQEIVIPQSNVQVRNTDFSFNQVFNVRADSTYAYEIPDTTITVKDQNGNILAVQTNPAGLDREIVVNI